jgi:hypothetical protein
MSGAPGLDAAREPTDAPIERRTAAFNVLNARAAEATGAREGTAIEVARGEGSRRVRRVDDRW